MTTGFLTTAPDDLVVVFEAAYGPLREMYLGSTDALTPPFLESFRRAPPPPARHWTERGEFAFNCVERAMPRRDVDEFIAAYAESAASIGWRVVNARR